MVALLQLVRFKNLIIIAVAMYIVLFYYSTFGNFQFSTTIECVNFLLMVLATVFIAAAGNIINDCMDVEADKINKPDKLIITRKISLNRAKLLYVNLNFIGFLTGCYLSFYYRSSWFIIVIGISILSLWQYSKSIKKKGVFGNLLVAFFIAFIFIWVYLYLQIAFYHQFPLNTLQLNEGGNNFNSIIHYFFIENNLSSFAIFFFAWSFILNYLRELIKDGQDIEGDRKIDSHSLAILLGEDRLKLVCLGILNATLLFFIVVLARVFINQDTTAILLSIPLIIEAVLIFLTITILQKRGKESFSLCSQLLKWMFLVGLFFPFWGWIVM